ncbi:MAG: hypothetical protein ACKVTZ_05105 [Bacteroidia bacterium]
MKVDYHFLHTPRLAASPQAATNGTVTPEMIQGGGELRIFVLFNITAQS